MEKTVAVREALNKGKLRLVYLPMIVIFTFITVSIFLSIINIVPKWIMIIVFISGFLFGWLVWSYFVNKWKIWAFENVRNVHELKRKAIEEKLIWQTGSWFEKSEFKSEEQKLKLKLLEKKFLEKDIYKDDPGIPKETIIFYSKTTLTFLLIVSLGLIVIGLYFLWEGDYIASFLFMFGLYLAYDQIKKLRNNEPQIIINNKGIKLKNEKLISWSRIYNDKVFTKTSGRRSTTYLSFNNEMIDIGELTIKFNDLENLLHVYRVRFENYNS